MDRRNTFAPCADDGASHPTSPCRNKQNLLYSLPPRLYASPKRDQLGKSYATRVVRPALHHTCKQGL